MTPWRFVDFWVVLLIICHSAIAHRDGIHHLTAVILFRRSQDLLTVRILTWAHRRTSKRLGVWSTDVWIATCFSKTVIPHGHVCLLRLICGGTGLSPMAQILRELFFQRRFDIAISMIYACPRPDAIPYYELLERKAASHPNFKLTCTVDVTAGLPWTEVPLHAKCRSVRWSSLFPGPCLNFHRKWASLPRT